MKPRNEVDALAQALGGMPVWGVLRNGAAARAGLRYGDIVLEVNGVKTPTVSEYFQARSLRDGAASVLIHRDGKELRVELAFDSVHAVASMRETAEEIISERMLPSPGPAPLATFSRPASRRHPWGSRALRSLN